MAARDKRSTCRWCRRPLSELRRRDAAFCSASCRALSSRYERRLAGDPIFAMLERQRIAIAELLAGDARSTIPN
jgi:hypothetical protein